MSTTVQCEGCGAVYETSSPREAVEEVNRCQHCAGRLRVLEPDEAADVEEQPPRPPGDGPQSPV